MKFEYQKYLPFLLIVIIGFLVYANSFKGGFIFDDELLIVDNPQVKNLSLVRIFTENISPSSAKSFRFFRPLQIITYALDYSFWGLNPLGFHITNTFLHISTALALFWLLSLLFGDKVFSLMASILFLVHPVHTEAVSYISGRADPLAGLFIFLAFIFYIKSITLRKTYFYLGMILVFILALLSRENSLILAGLILLYHYAFGKKFKWFEFLSIVALSLIYVSLRLFYFELKFSGLSGSTTFLQRIPGFFAALLNYLRLLVLPFDLHMEYGNQILAFNNLKTLLGAGIFIFLVIYIFGVKRRKGLFFLSFGWFFIALLPQSNLYPINAYMAEHWLYLPSIGFFLIVANFFARFLRLPRFKRFQQIAIGIFVVLVGFYSFLTLRQNTYWNSPSAFYKRTLNYSSESAGMYSNLGVSYYAEGKLKEAIASYTKAIEIDPAYIDAYNNLGLVYYDTGKKEEAISLFKKAIELDPRYFKACYNLGRAYRAMAKPEEAIAYFDKAIRLNPSYAEAYNSLGLVYEDMGKNQEAETCFKKAIEITPNYSMAYNNLATSYFSMRRYQEAIDAYQKAIELRPDYAEAYSNLAIVYYQTGNTQKAISLFEKTLDLNPSHAQACNNLSIIYFNNKDYKLAIRYYDKAKALGFNNPQLGQALRLYR